MDKKVIALYAKGVTTRDIKAQLEEIYGINVSPTMISIITDKVMGAAADWQSLVLDKVYPIVYLDVDIDPVQKRTQDDSFFSNLYAVISYI